MENPAAETPANTAGTEIGPIKFDWVTTVKYSAMFRVALPSPVLTSTAINPLNAFESSGDLNFHRGLVSNRADIFSEMDLGFGPHFGLRGSMEAWGNPVYNQRTANSTDTCNTLVGSIDPWEGISGGCSHYDSGTKDFMYLNAYLMDAFAYANFPVGNTTLYLKAGQFAQQWGQTLFFGSNGIAGLMQPIDLVKLTSEPDVQFKEFILPVPQISLEWQLSSRVSIGGYYQSHWRPTWFLPSGSYFNGIDIMGMGAETMDLAQAYPGGPWLWLKRGKDILPKNSGQFGVQLQVLHLLGMNWGFYGVQSHEKNPVADIAPGDVNNSGNYPGEIGSFNWIYPENIKAIGMSVTKTIGVVNWAAEFSGRWNQDLFIGAISDPVPGDPTRGRPR